MEAVGVAIWIVVFCRHLSSPFRLPGASLSAPGKCRNRPIQPVFVFSLSRETVRKSALAEGEGFEPPKACTLVVFKPLSTRPSPFVDVRQRPRRISRQHVSSANVRQRSP